MSDNSDDVRSFSLPTVAAIVPNFGFSEINDSRHFNSTQENYMDIRIFIMLKYLSQADIKENIDWARSLWQLTRRFWTIQESSLLVEALRIGHAFDHHGLLLRNLQPVMMR